MNKMSLLLLLHLVIMLAAETAIAGVPTMVVFGDSTVDTGNNNQIATLLKSNFPPYGRDFMGGRPTGRFSNGRVGTDFYAEAFGLGPIVPAYLDPAYGMEDFATSVCFASAGTGLDIVTSDVLSVIPIWKQVEYYKEYQSRLRAYLGEQQANQRLSEALYIISIGTNDFVENYFTPVTYRSKQFTVKAYVKFLINLARQFISELYHLGARKIAFTGLSPMGCVPLQRTSNFFISGGACAEDQNKAARDFNSKFQAMAVELNSALYGLQLKYLNLYDLLQHIVHHPSIYGFENVEVGCCATGLFELGSLCNKWSPFTCEDASKYVFWDAVHPTEKTSYIVASYLINTTLWQFM